MPFIYTNTPSIEYKGNQGNTIRLVEYLFRGQLELDR